MQHGSEYASADMRRPWWERAGGAVSRKEKLPEKESRGLLSRIKRLIMDQIVGEDPRPYGSDRFLAEEAPGAWARTEPRAPEARPTAAFAPNALHRLALTARDRAKIEADTQGLATFLELHPEEYAIASREAGKKLGMPDLPENAMVPPATLAFRALRAGADLRGLMARRGAEAAPYDGEPDDGLFDRAVLQKDAPCAANNEPKTSTWRKKKR